MGRKREAPVPEQYLELLSAYKLEEKRKKTKSVSRNTNQIEGHWHAPINVEASISNSQPPKSKADPPLLKLFMSGEDDSSEFDEEWDTVSLTADNWNDDEKVQSEDDKNIVVTLADNAPGFGKSRRKSVFKKETRLMCHLVALIIWFWHSRVRNAWVTATARSVKLKNSLPDTTLQELHPPSHLSATLSTKKLLDGLRHAIAFWNSSFNATHAGLQMPAWNDVLSPTLPAKIEEQGDKGSLKEFISGIVNCHGSVDLMSQGFCALLRAQGLDCRLVCSLQPPDFQSQRRGPSSKKPVSTVPIFWTEVWDPFSKQYITADPVTETVSIVRRRNNLEPALTSSGNIMRYCIAWDANGFARDVTRRYASQFNARTRKKRVDYVGDKWSALYNGLLGYFSQVCYKPKDITEIKDLMKRPLNEGLPTRVQDFVGHPVYALEDQLKYNEILEPREPCGRLALPKGSVPIFRRESVKTTHSAATWYRKGRVLKKGEQPKVSRACNDRLSGEKTSVGLYSIDQTELYIAPAVQEGGKIVKSQYNTIDIFQPTMIPAGAVHIRGKRAATAAKLLEIDYANAIVDVEFSRSGARSLYDGIVVAQQFELAVQAVINALEAEVQAEAKRAEELRLLMLWRRYIIAIQVWARIERMNPSDNVVADDSSESERWSGESDDNQLYEKIRTFADSSKVDHTQKNEFWEPQLSESEDTDTSVPIRKKFGQMSETENKSNTTNSCNRDVLAAEEFQDKGRPSSQVAIDGNEPAVLESIHGVEIPNVEKHYDGISTYSDEKITDVVDDSRSDTSFPTIYLSDSSSSYI